MEHNNLRLKKMCNLMPLVRGERRMQLSLSFYDVLINLQCDSALLAWRVVEKLHLIPHNWSTNGQF